MGTNVLCWPTEPTEPEVLVTFRSLLLFGNRSLKHVQLNDHDIRAGLGAVKLSWRG